MATALIVEDRSRDEAFEDGPRVVGEPADDRGIEAHSVVV